MTRQRIRTGVIGAYLAGTAASQIGTWCASTAVSWLVVRSDVHLLGLVVAVQLLPSTVSSPVIGSFVDRLPPRRTLIVTNLIAGLIEIAFAVIVITHASAIAVYFIVPPVLTVLSSVDFSCRQIYVSALVSDERRARFTGLSSLAGSVGRLLGPALAGILLATTSPGICFLTDTISFVLAAVLLPRVSRAAQTARAPQAGPAAAGADPASEVSIRSGLAYVLRTSALRSVIIVFTVASLAGFNLSTLIPLLAQVRFDSRPDVFGLLNSGVGAGALVGGLARARIRSRPLTSLRIGLLGLGGVLALIALPIGLGACVVAFAVVGAARIMVTASTQAELVTRADQNRRGAVSGLYLAAFNGTTPIGALIVSTITLTSSISVAFVVCGIGTLSALLLLGLPALQSPPLEAKVADSTRTADDENAQ